MASLRQSYEHWMNNDPDEIDTVDPTEEEMAHFEEEEAKHEKEFDNIVQCAAKFSSSLGVSKLSDEEHLSPALAGFVKEGIRFSFSNSDEFQLGSRLSFLSILIKYANWMKKEPKHKRMIASYLEEKENELKELQIDSETIHEDDLRALDEFRLALGLGESIVFSTDASTFGGTTSQHTSQCTTVTPSRPEASDHTDGDESRDTINDLTLAGTSAAQKPSRGSSMGSVRSMISSARSSLSPLYEEGNEEASEETMSTPSRSKRSRLDGSAASSEGISKRSRTEESEHREDGDSINDTQTPDSKTQTTFDGEQSDLDSPHK